MHKLRSSFAAITVDVLREITSTGIHLAKPAQDLLRTIVEMLRDIFLQLLH